MKVLYASLFGIFQAVTEFLPFSRASHFLMLQQHFHFQTPGPEFYFVTRLGILMAILVYFAKDLGRIFWETLLLSLRFRTVEKRPFVFAGYPQVLTLGLVAIAMVPTAAILYILRDMNELSARWFWGAGFGNMILGLLLIKSRDFDTGMRTAYEMNHRDAFFLGTVQGVGLIGNISRSGLTVLLGLSSGIEPKETVRFSCFLLIPVLMAAAIKDFIQAHEFLTQDPASMLMGFLASAMAGFFALDLLMRMTEKKKFFLFGFYAFFFGLYICLYSFLHRISW